MAGESRSTEVPASICCAWAHRRDRLASAMPAKPTSVTVRLMLVGALTNSVAAAHRAKVDMPATITRLRPGELGHTNSVAATPTMNAVDSAASRRPGTRWWSSWRSEATVQARPMRISALPTMAGSHSGTMPCSACRPAAMLSRKLDTAHMRSPGIGWRRRRSSASTISPNTTLNAAATASSERPSIVIAGCPPAILCACACGSTSCQKF